MYQSYGRVVRVVGRVIAHVPGYGVYECAGIIPVPWVYHESGGFVYNHQAVVFVNYVEGNVFGFDSGFVPRAVEHKRYDVERLYAVVAFHRLVVNVHEAHFGRLLYSVARCSGQVVEQELVYTQ